MRMRQREARPSLPRRWAVDCAAVCKCHRFGKLALCRQVAGDVLVVRGKPAKFFTHIPMRIKHQCAQTHLMANEAKWRGKVHIAADDYKSVSRLAHDVCHHLCGKIEPLIGSIFQQPMMEIESIDIKNRLLHLRYYGLQRQGPDFRPAPHRIAVAQRVVSNPSRGSSVLYQIRDAA